MNSESYTASVVLPSSIAHSLAESFQSGSAHMEDGISSGLSHSLEEKRIFRLHAASDVIFAAIKDLTFPYVGRELNRFARRLHEEYKVFLLHLLK